MAVQVLKARGVPEDRILFLNLIASPEGISNFVKKFPRLKVVTAFIDEVRVYNCCNLWTIANLLSRAWTRRSKRGNYILDQLTKPLLTFTP